MAASQEPTVFSIQCCQVAEILAAKHKSTNKNLVVLGKSGAKFFPDLSKKRPNFFEV
jgi:hypothetical protein